MSWLIENKFVDSIRNLGRKRVEAGSSGCTDYRTFIFCRLLALDDGLAERGLTPHLLATMFYITAVTVLSGVSIFSSAPLRERMDCLRCFLLCSLVLTVPFNEYAHRHRLQRLHKYLGSAMSTLRTGLQEERTIIDKARDEAASNLKIYMIIFFSNIIPMVLAQPITEWLSGRSWRKLPVPWSIPPTDTDLAFILIFCVQIGGTTLANLLGMIFMSFSAITVQMTALFDVLLLSLNHIEDRAKTMCKRQGCDTQTALVGCLRDDIIFYQQLIKELASVAPHLRNTFLTFSATVPMIMACEAFQMLTGDVTVGDITRSAVFLAIQFGCWAQTCIRLETMTDQHEAVFHALYATPWYESDAKFKKLVHNSLTYSTHPKHIKARLSTEVTATTATFYSFTVSSFNMLNVIRKAT